MFPALDRDPARRWQTAGRDLDELDDLDVDGLEDFDNLDDFISFWCF